MPTSTVSIPSRVAVIGPIVVPQGILFLETNIWWFTFADSQARMNSAAELEEVAYR